MAGPITWRNIRGPSFMDALLPLNQAQKTLDGSFDIFNKVIKDREASDAANVAQMQENNRNAYLNAVSAIKSPEEWAQQQAQLNQMFAGLDPESQAAVRDAAENRLKTARDLVAQSQQYDLAQLKHQYAPARDQILAHAVAGEKDKALALIDANPGMPDTAPLREAIVKGDRDLTRFQWAGNAEQRAQNEDQRATDRLNDQLANSNLTRANTQVQIERNRLSLRNEELAAEDAKRLRDARTLADKLTLEARKNQAGIDSNMQAALSRAPFPTYFNKDGTIAVEQYGTTERAIADQYLKEQGLPPLSSYQTGNTAAADNIRETLYNQGYSTREIATLSPQIDAGVDTTSSPRLGNDLLKKRYADAVQARIDQDLEDRYGVVATPAKVGELMEVARKAIQMYPKDAQENILSRVATYLDTGGIETGDGGRILPGPGEFNRLLSTIDRAWYTTDEFDTNQVLKSWAKQHKEGALKVYQTLKDKATRELKDKLLNGSIQKSK